MTECYVRSTPLVQTRKMNPSDSAGKDNLHAFITIAIITYNHAPFVADAVRSVLAQKTREPVDILISEDASTDATRDIVLALEAEFPDQIRHVFSEQNLRSNAVIGRALRASRGRYVAILDGDDYFIDPLRLQRQADFLDAHPECVAVFGNAEMLVGEKILDRMWTRSDLTSPIGSRELFEGNPFAICCGLFRGDAVRSVPAWYDGFEPMLTDWPLYVHLSNAGSFAFVDEPVAVYRQHPGGVFSSLSDRVKLDKTAGFYRSIAKVEDGRYARPALDGGARFFFDMAVAQRDAGDIETARSSFRRALSFGGVGRSIGIREALRLGRKLYLSGAKA